MGKSVFVITIMQAFAAFLIVTLGLLAIGKSLYISLIFGVIATATAPAATVMVMKEYRAQGPVTSMIMAVVGLDDAKALFMFSLISPIAYILFKGQGTFSLSNSLLFPILEIVGSIIVGLIIGYFSLKLIEQIEDKTKKVLLILAIIIGGV
jgi:NhaP-type Na+/H+ or K+/H+ antiporter